MSVCGRILAGLALGLLAFQRPAWGGAPDAGPAITGIAVVESNLVVTIDVPAGVRRITLAAQDRLGHGGWLPQAVCHLDGQGGELRVTIPRIDPCLVLRVSADDDGGLPGTAYDGTHQFVAEPASAPAFAGNTRGYGVDVLTVDGGVLPPTVDPGAETREVVESDIWKLHGDRLYFFNQYRGLQVIDVADPDQPVLLGTLSLPAAGEQMYVLNDRYVALLVGTGCGYGADDGGACLVVDVGDGAPAVAATLPVAGNILESRLVGTALYVASAGYLPGADGATWTWRSTVTSFDLADPVHPVQRQQFAYPGYDPVFTATDQWLFAALRSPEDYRSSVIHAINIASPAGYMWEAARLPLAGQVPDQFKMQLQGDVFSVIYETLSGVLSTRLENYRFLGLLGFWRLGAVELAAGERLFATRFDGDRVYIVTFEQIDPLWVVDLSDPRQPAIVGELEVPGFSTHIHPMGDRLVTVGRENSQVAVSLFGVADPAHPVLLDRVLLGDEAWWSTSEATFDEKAFGVLEGEGLILVPFEYVSENGWVSAVQLVDLLEEGLAERGRIEHGLRARRATVVGERVVSVSGRELTVVDAGDRDQPVVTATLPLSWPVNRVFGYGDFLVELATGANGYGEPAGAVARIVTAADPGDVLAAVALGPLPVIGATLRDGHLFLAQAEGGGYPYYYDYRVATATTAESGGESDPPEPVTYPMTVSVYDLAALPAFESVGRVEAKLEQAVWGEVEPLWPRDGVLVWKAQQQYWPIWLGGAVDAAFRFVPWYGAPECRLLAFDVSDPAQPAFGSDFVLPNTHWASSRGDVLAHAGLVYTSHSLYQDVKGEWIVDAAVNPDGTLPLPEPVSRCYVLDVIDYEDPAEPTLRPPAMLPGLLSGVSHHGNLLYTVAYRETVAEAGTWQPTLDVLAYDGIAAHHMAGRRLPESWTGWVKVVGKSAISGYGTTQDAGPGLLAMTVTDQGELVVAGQTDVPAAPYELVVVDDLVVAQAGNLLLAYDAAALPAFRLLADESPDGCFGYNLRYAHGHTGAALWIPLGDYGLWTVPLARVALE